MEEGVQITDPDSTFISPETTIGADTLILPNVYITGKNTIGKNCKIGPFTHIRDGATIGNNVRIGNFVEVKNSTVGSGSKISHLAYVGDATIGKNCNIGCGAIFVNYNGKTKNKTIVGNNSFIGSNCNIIAPVKIDDKSYICAGTTITDDVKSGDFVIGRVRQSVKENRAKDYLKESK